MSLQPTDRPDPTGKSTSMAEGKKPPVSGTPQPAEQHPTTNITQPDKYPDTGEEERRQRAALLAEAAEK